MAKLLKLRRGTTTQHGSFTGAEAEVTVDTTKDTIVVHDNSTAGGRPLLREDLDNLAATGIPGAKIANDAIDSQHYADGSIDTAHIADDQVTQAKIANNAVGLDELAGIARGKIIYGDASGDPAVLTAGSNGQVLQSDGTDISWQNNSAGATGGNSNANRIFWENEQSVTHDYTIQNNHNAGSFGPITINASVTVTVGAGEHWTII